MEGEPGRRRYREDLLPNQSINQSIECLTYIVTPIRILILLMRETSALAHSDALRMDGRDEGVLAPGHPV